MIVKKSEYIELSRILIRKLYDETCFGKGSLYVETLKCQKSPLAISQLHLGVRGRFLSMLKNTPRALARGRFLTKGIPKDYIDKVEVVLNALVKQEICGKKKKRDGWKYYLNIKRIDKIREIIKEKGDRSIIPILLML